MTIDLDVIEAAAKAAAPGTWTHELDSDPPDAGIFSEDGLVATIHHHANVRTSIATGQQFSHADARYIATANPAAVLRLCAELRAARAVVEAAQSLWTRDGDCIERIRDALVAYDAAVSPKEGTP